VRTVPPLYGEKYRGAEIGLRWKLKQSWCSEGRRLKSDLRIDDLEHVSTNENAHTMLINATCSNGELSQQLSVSSDIQCHDSISLPADISLLRRPKPQVRIKATEQDAWPLLAHLHFNYQAIFGADNPVSALKDMLYLYNHNESSQNEAYIDAIVKLEQEQAVAPIRISGKSCFANGTR
ncbi:type VI secretion system baseplate subunit TssF, partial [Vibrio harveyi]|uniref:type VI secretion system baseplate subunit TssF n=1 Tax=Vibrio harveyi TaxID=669 RepID=UPI0018F157C2